MTDTTAPLDLDAIEARANAAARGPWVVGGADPSAPGSVYLGTATDPDDSTEPGVLLASVAASEAEFIAHAREDLPALVTAVRARDEMLSKISAAVAAGTYSNRELREAIQHIANVLDGADQREPRATCFCGGEHITGTCLAPDEET